jgi:hypothetical protein
MRWACVAQIWLGTAAFKQLGSLWCLWIPPLILSQETFLTVTEGRKM